MAISLGIYPIFRQTHIADWRFCSLFLPSKRLVIWPNVSQPMGFPMRPEIDVPRRWCLRHPQVQHVLHNKGLYKLEWFHFVDFNHSNHSISIHIFIYLPIYLSFYLFIYLSFYLFIYLSIYLILSYFILSYLILSYLILSYLCVYLFIYLPYFNPIHSNQNDDDLI